jgi:hypothetical protein
MKPDPDTMVPVLCARSYKWFLYPKAVTLKGLSHEIDFKNVDENGQILALLRAAAGF